MAVCSLGLTDEQVKSYAVLAENHVEMLSYGDEGLPPEIAAEVDAIDKETVLPRLRELGETVKQILAAGALHIPGCEPCNTYYTAAANAYEMAKASAVMGGLRTTGPGKAGLEGKL